MSVNQWLIAAILTALCSAAYAANGDLDPNFGIDGIALTGLLDVSGTGNPCGPVVQPDRKILLCTTRVDNGTSGSDFFIARFTADGELDTSFSFDGRVTVDFDGDTGSDSAFGIALQADGRIIVVGATRSDATGGNQDFAIVRLLDDGSLDPSFGAGTGKKVIAFNLDAGSGADIGASVAIQPDARIVIAGQAQTTVNGTDFAIARLLADGTPDSSFNLTGKVTVAFNLAPSTSRDDGGRRVAVDRAGRIVVAGSADRGTLGNDFAVVRLLPNGLPDGNFDADGRATVAFDLGGSNSDSLFGMTVLRDGAIALTGISALPPNTNTDIAVARLLADGSLDSAFGFLGKTLVAFDLVPSGQDIALSVIEQSNGKLVIVGAAQYSVPARLAAAVTRLHRNGALDSGFGILGKKTYDFGLAVPSAQAFVDVAFQGSQIIVGGITDVPGGIDALLVRLENDLLFADGFD